MCLIVFAWQPGHALPLLVAANRDEFYARPSLPLAAWEDAEGVFAGRDLEAAAALAERLRQRVRSQSFEMGERLTASFGVGVLNDGETLDLLLCRVDDALYRAKQRRDCVACC